MPEQEQSAGSTKTVTLKLPSGKMQKLVVPKDATAEQVRTLVHDKHPELLGEAAPPPSPEQTLDQGPKPPDLKGTSFMQGVGQGLNPFHSAPEGLPGRPLGKGADVAEDMFNIREGTEMAKQGNYKGAAGMAVGSAGALLGPDLLKGGSKLLKGSGVADKALTMASRSQALTRAKTTARAIGGGIKDARIGEKVVQPIVEALNKKFEPLHKALEQHIIPLNSAAQALVKRIVQTEPEMIKEVSNLVRTVGGPKGVGAAQKAARAVRTALDYREADKLVSRLKGMAKESPQIAKLAEEIEKEIDTVAKAAGKGAERDELKSLWGEMHAVKNSVIDSVKSKSMIRSLVKTVSSKAGAIMAEGEKVAGSKEVEAADKLLQKITGNVKSSGSRAAGKVAGKAASTWKAIPPAWRAINSMFTESSPPDGGGV